MTVASAVGGYGQVTANGVVLATFRMEAASTVTIDRKNASRRSCQIKLTDLELEDTDADVIPTTPKDLFAPYGNEMTLFFSRTIDGVDQDTQVGVFLITRSVTDDTGSDLTLTVNGLDRAKSYTRAGFTDVYTIAASTNLGTAIQSLLQSRNVPFTQTFNFAAVTATTGTTPTVLGPGDDPWAKAQEMAAAAGCELYPDAYGVIVLTPVPDPSVGTVVASYIEGDDNTAVHVRRDLSNDSAANYVICDGQGTGITAPVRGTASDTNPDSPTYVNGPYGQFVDYQSSNLWTSSTLAGIAASAKLLVNLGSVEVTQWDVLHDPERNVDDVFEGQRVRAGVAADSKYVIDTIALSFDPNTPMSITARGVT
jgi:hypothetical protein